MKTMNMVATENMLQNLQQALLISPDNAPLLRHVADVEFDLKYFSDALEKYQKALRLKPHSTWSKFGLAKCYYELGKYSTGLVVAEELLQDPKAPQELSILLAYLYLANEEEEKALTFHLRAKEAGFYDEVLAYQLEHFPTEKKDLSSAKETEEVENNLDIDDFVEYFEKPSVNFSHVGGLNEVKDEIRSKIINYKEHSKWYAEYGKKAGGGILLYGPPGCGKTHIAKAVAGEKEIAFLSVGIHEILDMFTGKSEKNLNKIFELASARTPCVLFFDEVDALGASRTDMKKNSSRHLINQFLSEMDGIDSDNEGLLALAATNAPWNLDAAFRRPGRFDKMMFVPPPDFSARAVILGLLLKELPTGQLDLDQICQKTEEFSGADLTLLVNTASDFCLAEAIKAETIKPIAQEDLLRALDKVKPSTREWFKTARNYAEYANDGGQYDDILKYLNERDYLNDELE